MAKVKDKRLCNNCLATGHYVRACTKRSFCKVQGCSGTHSTFLHPKRGETKHERELPTETNAKTKEDLDTQDSKDGTNDATIAYIKSELPKNKSITGLAIVPVKVKTGGSFKTVETYAFLDSGSNTTFCTDALLKRLGIKGEQTKLSLTMMQGKNAPIKCALVSLVVADLDGNCDVKLPLVNSRPC